jgi:2'-5' RNA ligase
MSKYATTHIPLPPDIAQKVQEFGKSIAPHHLAEDGLEKDPHITVKYGLHSDASGDVKDALKNEMPARFKLTGLSCFPATAERKSDVLIAGVHSPDLQRLNQLVSKATPHVDTFRDYKPHATIAYLKPGMGKEYAQPSPLDGMEGVADTVIHSSRDGAETKIKLTGQSRDTTAMLSRSAKNLESTQIARCAHCGSEDIYRRAGRHASEGPTDHCEHCGHSFPHKPGTITAQQHIDRVAATLDGGVAMMSRISLSLASEVEGHWVTIGSEGEPGDRHGGSPVFIKGGEIIKGPKSLAGKTISSLKKGKASSTPQARTAEFHQRVKEHRAKGLDTARAVARAHSEMSAKAKPAAPDTTPKAPPAAPKPAAKPAESEPRLHSTFEHEGVNVAVMAKDDHRGTVYSTKWDHEGEGHNSDQWVFSPNRAKDDARYAIDQKLKMLEPKEPEAKAAPPAAVAKPAEPMKSQAGQAAVGEIPTLPHELASAIRAHHAPDWEHRELVRVYGAERGNEEYRQRNGRDVGPTEDEKAIYAKGQAIAKAKGWDWDAVKDKTQQQLKLDKNWHSSEQARQVAAEDAYKKTLDEKYAAGEKAAKAIHDLEAENKAMQAKKLADIKAKENEATPVQELDKAKAAHAAGDTATFQKHAKAAVEKTKAGKKPPISDRKQLRQDIHQAYKDQGGGLPVEVYRHAESLQNPFTFKKGSALAGEVRSRVGSEGGKEGVGIARSGAINFTDDATKSGGEDAINSFRERFGNSKGEDYYWQMARERAGYGWQDALNHARNSNDPELRFKAALHDTMLSAKERPGQDKIDPQSLKVGEEFTINHIPVEVTEDMEGDKVLRDHGKIPETPLASLQGKLTVDKGTLKEKELPKGEEGDFFADVREEEAPALKSKAGKEATDKPHTYIGGDRAEYTGKVNSSNGLKTYEVEMTEGHLKGQKRDVLSPPENPTAESDANAKRNQQDWHQQQEGFARLRKAQEAEGLKSQAAQNLDVDVSRQFGLYAKDATGNPLEVGEHAGQANLFNPSKYKAVEKPVEPVVKPQFDAKHTAEMFPAAEMKSAAGASAEKPKAAEPPHNEANVAASATALKSKAAKAAVADSEYAYARPSTVSNAGEDLANSARHKRNAWRGLGEAEANGTAEQLVTRDKLLENEPHNIAASVDKNPMTALAMHHAMKAFPPSPAHGRGYEKTAPELKAVHRQQYVQTYQNIKAKAEELAATEPNAVHAMDRLRNHISDKVRELRGQTSNDSIGMATATDRYNPVANGLVGTSNDLRTFRTTKTSVGGKLLDFTNAHKQKYGEGAHIDQSKEHVRDIIGGKSLHQTFGSESPASGRQKKFNPADVYVGKAERVGGRDVSQVASEPNAASNHLLNSFKMRGVQWGNSVTDDERAHHAKHVVGALTDLAEATGLKPEDISLNGKLGLAIGARGHGGASAHYEPGNKVINLTRESGVGTLAHEWGHAFDHDLAGGNLTRLGDKVEGDYQSGHSSNVRMVKAKPGEPTTYGGYKSDEKGKPVTEDLSTDPVHSAMAGVRESWNTSGYRKRIGPAIRQLDNEGILYKNPQYWTSPHEMFARTFENHVNHTLEQQGRKNTYLAGFSSGDFDPKSPVNAAHLWPTKEESAHMAPAFNKLMAAYRQKKYGNSEPVTFSRAAASQIIALSLRSHAARTAAA